jgi:hypothetical protein
MWILWSILENDHCVVSYEQFLNPLHRDSEQLITDLANQAFLKVVLVNSLSGEVIDLVEFENSFIGSAHVEAIRQLRTEFGADPLEPIDFTQVVQEFMRDISIEDLIE